MIDRLEPTPAPKLSLEELAKGYAGRNGIVGDLVNNTIPLRGDVKDQKYWPEVVPALTYEQYLRATKPELADMVMQIADKELVAQYDDIIGKINAAIGTGVTTQAQADSVRTLVDETVEYIRNNRSDKAAE